jgi:Bacteriophage protein gp37
MVNRFSGNKSHTNSGDIHVYEPPPALKSCKVQTAGVTRKAPARVYPFGFEPTFYPERLNEPSKLRKPSTIFVGSMCDMWGDWVPNEWINEILCALDTKVKSKIGRSKFIFLTKNPTRYDTLRWERKMYRTYIYDKWFGASITTSKDASMFSDTMRRLDVPHRFFSAEPLLEGIAPHVDFEGVQWLIIGALTKNGRVVPPEQGGTRPEWVEALVDKALVAQVPIFLKNSVGIAPFGPYNNGRGVNLRALPYLEEVK